MSEVNLPTAEKQDQTNLELSKINATLARVPAIILEKNVEFASLSDAEKEELFKVQNDKIRELENQVETLETNVSLFKSKSVRYSKENIEMPLEIGAYLFISAPPDVPVDKMDYGFIFVINLAREDRTMVQYLQRGTAANEIIDIDFANKIINFGGGITSTKVLVKLG